MARGETPSTGANSQVVREQPALRTVADPCIICAMHCKIMFGVVALVALAACQSPGGLAQKAPAWTATYQVPYDTMANCLVERERLPWVTVTPSIYSPERRATVTVTSPTGSALGVYDIRQVSARDTDVTYRSIYGGPGSGAGGDALDKANGCGNPV
jgi:hypothetical protein